MAKEIKEDKKIRLKKASLFKRFIAYLIDITIINLIVTFALGDRLIELLDGSFNIFSPSSEILFYTTIFSLAMFIYFTLSEFFTFQTIGKSIMNLHVIPINYYYLFNSDISKKVFDFNPLESDSKITQIKKDDKKSKKEDKNSSDDSNEDLSKKITLLSGLFRGNLSVLSSIIRSIYLLPLFSFISTLDFLFIFFTRLNQRILEFASKTVVVEFSYEEELVI